MRRYGSRPVRASISPSIPPGRSHAAPELAQILEQRVQVLNEFAHVGMRKLRLPLDAIEAVMKATLGTCRVHDLTLRDTVNALSLCGRHGFAFYDAVIVASALRAGCTTLWSEDFHQGMKLQERLTVRNPFKPE